MSNMGKQPPPDPKGRPAHVDVGMTNCSFKRGTTVPRCTRSILLPDNQAVARQRQLWGQKPRSSSAAATAAIGRKAVALQKGTERFNLSIEIPPRQIDCCLNARLLHRASARRSAKRLGEAPVPDVPTDLLP